MSSRTQLSAQTKIVATLGPASEPVIGEMIDAGLSVARINFSHGTAADHRRRVSLVREEASKRRAVVGILADIQGPKLRLGLVGGGKRRVRRDDVLVLKEGPGPDDDGEVFFDFPGFLELVLPGHRIFLADGVVELEVESSSGDHLVGRVVRGGGFGDRKGVSLPDTDLALELPTPKDRVDLEIARELQVDMIGASFVGGPRDVIRIRTLAPEKALIVAKIERASALEEIEGIFQEADGIMIARGDLGVEVELEKLPMWQKKLTAAARRAGRFTITATEMLESMQHAPRPTRAEAADVANAVLEGADAVMLSAETAVGEYPVEAVATMSRIAHAVETSEQYHAQPRVELLEGETAFSNALARAAVEASENLGIDTIVCFTETGYTARLVSRYRPNARIIALSPNLTALRRMTLLAHVTPVSFSPATNLEEMLSGASEQLVRQGYLRRGEELVFIAGVPPGTAHSTNVLKLHRIGDPILLH